MNQNTDTNIESKIHEDLSPTRNLTGLHLKIVLTIAIIWSLFQLWYASPFPFWFNIGMFKGLPARAIHLGFALLLAFLIFPFSRSKKISIIDILISIIGAFCCLYIYFFYDQLVDRGGILLKITLGQNINIPIELIIGIIGILILLEATRRVIGLPLVIIAICFLLFSFFGRYAPDIISHGGLSLKRLVGFQWFDQEAIFGIPIGVSVDFIFLFVLFGALLETAGGGKYFLDLAFAMVGKMRGGPAKAAILGSGMTGLISGSSIANVVTTGTFTIPLMRKVGFSAEKAGEFYAVHKERPFYGELVEFMSSGPIVAAILEKDNAVADFRTLIGATNPAEAAEGTIRKKYGTNMGENAVHGSDSDENAEIESNFFFSGREIF